VVNFFAQPGCVDDQPFKAPVQQRLHMPQDQLLLQQQDQFQ
jgi:hypothetical protein